MRRSPILLFAALLSSSAAAAGAQTATLVADLNTATPFAVAPPQATDLLPLSDKLFFTAGSQVGEPEVTDGLRTEILGDLCPGDCGSRPEILGRLGNVALFLASTGTSGSTRFYRSDGTRAGTFDLGNSAYPYFALLPGQRVRSIAGGLFFFLGCPAGVDCELWKTDGTRAGTVRVKDIAPGSASPGIDQITAVGRRVFFTVQHGTHGPELWTSDGSEAGTARLAELGINATPRLLTAGASRLFFLSSPEDGADQLWTSDGTPAGTRPVTGFALPGALAGTHWLAVYGDRAYFLADDAVAGTEIWTSDGTPAGTRKATAFGYFSPFEQLRDPAEIQELGGRLVFPANDGLHGLELWASAAPPAAPGPPTLLAAARLSADSRLVKVGSRVVFSALGDAGDELWSTDGTPAGTRKLVLTCPGTCDAGHLAVVPLLGAAFFVGYDRAHGQELWTSDGTPGGTRRFTDALPDDGTISLTSLAALGRQVYLTVGGGNEFSGNALWTSDGTPGGTRPVPGSDPVAGAGSDPQQLTAVGQQLFFTACDGTSRNLWRSLGIPSGTQEILSLGARCEVDLPLEMRAAGGGLFFWRSDSDGYHLWHADAVGHLAEIATFGSVFNPPSTAALGNEVFFALDISASSGSISHEIWRSDGTPAGTRRDPNLVAIDQLQANLIADGGILYIVGSDTPGRFETWRTDGTAAGTRKLLDLGLELLGGTNVATAGPWAFFVTTNVTGSRLWRTDGTAGGTVPVHDFPQGVSPPAELLGLGSRLYFFVGTKTDRELWSSDGTPDGTLRIRAFPKDIFSYFPAADPVSFLGRLFFAVDDGVHGRELWSTDGTAAGTVLVADINPGPASSQLDQLTVAGGSLYFTAYDVTHGIELWASDGTVTGTRLVQDLAPESASSSPRELTAVGDRLFFTADDGLSGREPWMVTSGQAGCQPGETRLCLQGGRFAVEAEWKDFSGRTGVGHATALTADTGTFWFFSPDNLEVVTKVLDGRGLNQAFWVFYGALSSVEYSLTVTDTTTGLSRRYLNPAGRLASVGDTAGFGPLGAFSTRAVIAPLPEASQPAAVGFDPAVAGCVPGPRRLCLAGGRFAVTATWKDFSGRTGVGTTLPLTGDTGGFWFFDAANVEVLLKVLDGRALNGRFWVFYGALSNVAYTLTVTDTATGVVRTYENPSGRFASVADTGAFE